MTSAPTPPKKSPYPKMYSFFLTTPQTLKFKILTPLPPPPPSLTHERNEDCSHSSEITCGNQAFPNIWQVPYMRRSQLIRILTARVGSLPSMCETITTATDLDPNCL